MDPITALANAVTAICGTINVITEAHVKYLEGMTPEQREKYHDRLQAQLKVAEAFWAPLTNAILKNSDRARS